VIGGTGMMQKSVSNPYSHLPLAFDSNHNYRKYAPGGNSCGDADADTLASRTTVIPNLYSIREDMRRELRLSKQDFVNNNLVSPVGPKAKTPVSPTHHARQVPQPVLDILSYIKYIEEKQYYSMKIISLLCSYIRRCMTQRTRLA
jgi:hypothetical protein